MKRAGFSLLELVGVVAILAILTALVLPRMLSGHSHGDVIQTVSAARLTQSELALQSLNGIIMAHLAQSGSLNSSDGRVIPFSDYYDDFGRVLLKEGLLDRPFSLSIGTNTILRLRDISFLNATSPIGAMKGAYDLRGSGQNTLSGARFLVEAVVYGATEAEARALNDRIDGAALGAGPDHRDLLGRVIYGAPEADGRFEVHVYVLSK